LKDYKNQIVNSIDHYQKIKEKIECNQNIGSFANGYLYFGFHHEGDHWIFREWAPAADEINLIGDFNHWNRSSHPLKNIGSGIWEITLSGTEMYHTSKIKLQIKSNNHVFDRIPSYITRVIQDSENYSFDGQFWEPQKSFSWTDENFQYNKKYPLIYECHVGMSAEKECVSSFKEFTETILPRIKSLGYNAVQIMAVMEHPYYASFGYQVSNFFAVSSRFGTPEDFKSLVNEAHRLGLAVILDLVHSHSSGNVLEGLAEFDGTDHQYFSGEHPVWGTKIFDYGKTEVLHFLLSNLKFWLEEYHLDGFRFDGVTSMLYHDHGLGRGFHSYNDYFTSNTNLEALTYLRLAVSLCRKIKPDIILIAEDVSGYPGLCLPEDFGGIGFDFRLAMGIPDFWIKALQDEHHQNFNLGMLWHEFTQRSGSEKVIAYAESHDQALVGDKTIMSRLAGDDLYWHMELFSHNDRINRAMSYHKLIRLITSVLGGEGYLTFMGNEFGHPDWIDFPREGNNWSYQYAKRMWSLSSDPSLRYQYLEKFDHAMIAFVNENHIFDYQAKLIFHHEDDKILIFQKADFLFCFNFHKTKSCTVKIPLAEKISFKTCLHSNWNIFGGHIVDLYANFNSTEKDGSDFFEYYLEPRSAVICEKYTDR
jgi:1,4-alpha-glucan branching enzyme